FTATVRARRAALADGDDLGLAARIADREIALALRGTDVVAALDGGSVVASAPAPATEATLRLRRIPGMVVADIDTGAGFEVVHTFVADVPDGGASVGAFL